MEERRRGARWQINQRAGLTVKDGLSSIPCVVEDISTRGMRLSLKKSLFPEAFSNFNIALSDGFEFNSGAQVAWSEKVYEEDVYGLSFSRIEEPVKNRIVQYIKDNFPDEMRKQLWSGT
jgi:c-di-GMP-binding flagellar brake protein YcgR